MTEAQIDYGFEIYKKHVKRFGEAYLSKNKTPRNHVWRPYRFATRDVVIGNVVVRHSQGDNLLEVDVCLTHTPDIFEDYEAERVMLTFLLAEAFKCGGSIEIRFTKEVEGGEVPTNIRDFALWNEIYLDMDHALS